MTLKEKRKFEAEAITIQPCTERAGLPKKAAASRTRPKNVARALIKRDLVLRLIEWFKQD